MFPPGVQRPVYLDDDGNPIQPRSAPVYLDESGEPIAANPLDTVGPGATMERLGIHGNPREAEPHQPTFSERMKAAIPAAIETAAESNPIGAGLLAIPKVAEAATGAFKAAPAAVGETIFGQPLPGHEHEPDSFLGRLKSHAQMVLSGNGGAVEPIGPIRAITNPPDTYAGPTSDEDAIHRAEMGQPQGRVRSRAEQVALETGRRGLDMAAQIATDPTAVAAMGVDGPAGELLAAAFSADGLKRAADVARNPNATPEDVAEAALGVAVQSLPLAVRHGIPAAANVADAAAAEVGSRVRAGILAAKLNVPNLQDANFGGLRAGIHAPIEAAERVGGLEQPPPVGETLSEAVRTAAAPETGEIHYNEGRDRAVPQYLDERGEPIPSESQPAQEPPTSAPPVAARPGASEAVGPVAPSPEPSPGAPAATSLGPEFAPVGDEPAVSPTTPLAPASPTEPGTILERINGKLAAGGALGTAEARAADEMRRRGEEAREAAIKEIDDALQEPGDNAVSVIESLRNGTSKEQRDHVQTGASAQPGIDREAAANDLEAHRRGGVAATGAWLQAIASGDSPAGADAAYARAWQSLAGRERQDEVLGSAHGSGQTVRTPDGDVGSLGTTAIAVGARAPQERGWIRQPPGESGTAQRSGASATPSAPSSLVPTGGVEPQTGQDAGGHYGGQAASLVDVVRSLRQMPDRQEAARRARALSKVLLAGTQDERAALIGAVTEIQHAVPQHRAVARSFFGGVRAGDEGARGAVGEGDAGGLREPADASERLAQEEAAVAGSAAPAEGIASQRDLSTGSGPLTIHERREMGRMLAEMESLPYVPRTRTVIDTAPRGKDEYWVAGAGGASVFNDIGGSSSRSQVIKAIQRVLSGGRVTAIGQRAIDVARARLTANARGGDLLPVEAGNEPGQTYVETTRDMTPDEAAVEKHFRDAVEQQTPGMVDHYLARYGNVVNADNAKELSPEYAASPESRARFNRVVHRGSSALADAVYQRLVSEPTPNGHEPEVTFIAGGTGAGKSRFIEDPAVAPILARAQAVVDGPLTHVGRSEARIQFALHHGKGVNIVYVHRDPVEAWQAVQTRAQTIGRAPTLDYHVNSHVGGLATIKTLSEIYADNPNVHIEVVHNQTGQPLSYESVSKLPEAYNAGDVRAAIQNLRPAAAESDRAAGEAASAQTGALVPVPEAAGSARADVQFGAESPRQPEAAAVAREHQGGHERPDAYAARAEPESDRSVLQQQPIVDRLDTGEEQPRLPGDVGSVREREIATPKEEAPFSLMPEAAEREAVQPTLREAEPAREFSSTQVDLPPDLAAAVREAAARIPDEDLADDGRENDPHVTVKFGLHTNDPAAVARVLRGEGPIHVRLGKVSIFPAKEGAAYDVVKADIDSPDLHRLNAKIAAALPHTDTHPKYVPHATIAYVKPGLGAKYVGDTSLAGREALIDAITFSGKDRRETTIPLGPKPERPKIPVTPKREPGVTLQSAVIPGAKELYEQDIEPAIQKAAEDVSRARKDIRATFAPDTVGEGARLFADVMRANLAAREQRIQRAQRVMMDTEKAFERRSDDANLHFIDAIEGGRAMSDLTSDEQVIAKELRHLLDSKRAKVQEKGRLENYIENYFPHEWKQPSKARDLIRRLLGKKPLQGPATFLKKRTIPTVREGIDAGLEPTTTNPVTLVLHKLAEMDKWITARDILDESKDLGIAKFVRSGATAPDGWKRFHESFGTVYGKGENGELMIRGHYYGPPDATRILDNYLSPGRRGNAAFDVYRGLGNTMNQVQLGLSGFHLTMTGIEAVVSKVALGLEELSRGEFGRAAKSLAEAPISTFTTLMKGDRVLKALYEKDANAREFASIADQVIQAGGGVARDKTMRAYDTRVEGLLKAYRKGNILGAALRVPGAVFEIPTRIIMEQWVPRLKLGAFLDLARMELRTLGPDPDITEVRRVLGKAWDTIDNRFGQLVYDNLFWKNTLKDAGMASVRALGWNVGTAREVFGAPSAQFGQLKALATGKPAGGATPTRLKNTGYDPLTGNPEYGREREPWLTHKAAYVAALTFTVALVSALYEYLHTGDGPKQARDYFFPRTGAKRPDGREERVSFPSYFKDVYAFFHALPSSAAETVGHKLHPLLNLLYETLWTNEDYFGTQIRNPDAPGVQQLQQVLKHVIDAFEPMSVRSFTQRKEAHEQQGIGGLESFFGVTPAPASVYRSKAEDLMREYLPPSVKTQAQADAAQAARALREGVRTGNRDEMRGALATGQLSRRQVGNAVRGSGFTPLQAGFRHLSLEQAFHVYEVATEDERASIWPLLLRKMDGLMSAAPADQPALASEFQKDARLPRGRIPVTAR